MTPNLKATLLALSGFGLFATHDVLVKFLGSTYSPFQILFFGALFGFPLISFMLIRDPKPANMRPRHPWWTALRTGSMLVSAGCIFYAFSALPLAQTYALIFTVPLMITLLAIPILGERVGLHRGVAVVVGFVGVLIAVNPVGAQFGFAHLVAIGGALSSALAMVIVRRIGRDERDLVLLMFPMLAMFLVMGAFMPFTYVPMPFDHLLMVAGLSLLGFLATNCMIVAYQAGQAGVVAPMQYSQILWALVYGLIFFNEVPDRQTLIGAGIIILSGIYIVVRETRGQTSTTTPVLRTRSRLVTGVNQRIGPQLPDDKRR